jgi:hypothetical protein
VRFADRSGERVLTIPPALELAPPASLGGDPRQDRIDWQMMAAVEIAPYTELCRSILAKVEGRTPLSSVPVATFADGVANMRVMDAIRESARNGGQLISVS